MKRQIKAIATIKGKRLNFSRYSKPLFFAIMVVLMTALSSTFSSCAAGKKNPWYEKRIKASRTNTSQLGRNRYYFSNDYQKKLYKSYKRR